jgi:hypothetical protein
VQDLDHGAPPGSCDENYPGNSIGTVVRVPLTPAELARGQRLGALLRRARGDRSMLRTALEARVSPETLRKIETGRLPTPAFGTIVRLSEVLGVSLSELALIWRTDPAALSNAS